MEQKLTTPPRVVFLSSGGLLGDVALRVLEECGELQIVGVVRSRRVMLRGAGFLRGAAAYFLRCGIIYTVYIWTITTFAEFVGFFTGTGSITARARRAGTPVLHARDLNDQKGMQFLRKLKPDLVVSAHFDQRLYPPLCDGTEFSVVNIHPSPLPHCRGLEPVLHTMKSGDSRFGVTVHRLSASIDTGAVLAREQLEVDPKRSVLGVTYELVRRGVELLIDHLEDATQAGKGQAQEAGGSYHSWPRGHDILQLYRSGKQLAKPSDLLLFWGPR